ncbi:MAG: endonuclease III domain-containing protein [Gammaproteobacteria bacterium]|nr:endonuclease III domain-containing protein [Gammaproteobacteria bacterium]
MSLQLPGAILQRVHAELLAAYGPQDWWPAETDFEVMVGAILTQNTAWSNVEKAIANLRQADLLDPQRLAFMEPGELAQIIRPAGYYSVKAKRLQAFCRFYQERGDAKLRALATEPLRQALLAVHGVGPETADDMLLYAFARPVFVIDTYTRRLLSRLGLCSGKEPYEVLRLAMEQALPADVALYNSYHALIVQHAKAYCRKQPACAGCRLLALCPQAIGP